MSYYQCVVVGSCGIGKTSLLSSYSDPKSYLPIQDYLKNQFMIQQQYKVGLHKRASTIQYFDIEEEDDPEDRRLFYKRANVVLLCFSLEDPESLEELRTNYNPEVLAASPNVPKILIGTHHDIREEKLKKGDLTNIITFEQGLALMTEINAAKYIECSVVSRYGIDEVFDAVAWGAYGRYVKPGKH